jgi:uncharacterized membrane protein YoaK (UPF0700 family)
VKTDASLSVQAPQPFNLRSKRLAYFWLGLSLQSGALNAGAWIACGKYASHLTGSATKFGVELAQGHILFALSMLSLALFFVLGGMVSGALIDLNEARGERARWDRALGIEFLILFVVLILAVFDVFGAHGKFYNVHEDYILVALLSLASGIQNALFTRRWGTVIRTTHITGTATDLGIGIVKLFYLRHSKIPSRDLGRVNILRAGSIVFFCVGALIGASLHLRFGYAAFLFATLLCLKFYFAERLFTDYRKKN